MRIKCKTKTKQPGTKWIPSKRKEPVGDWSGEGIHFQALQ